MGLAEDILETRQSGNETDTTLKSDQRVIARVTDGIYRRPGSAIRELISNAYDADAHKVTIDTDAPRFDKMTITDDGIGMSPQTLAYVLEHIGGSAKRTTLAAGFGLSSSNNPNISPGGRKLIGKIGIGLFSVAQLSRSFQIITKTKGDSFRTIASVTLKSYSEDELLDGEEFESGIVRIWSEKATDIDAQGTTITITNLHPQTKNTLRSLDTWVAIEESDGSIEAPNYHIGATSTKSNNTISNTAVLPYADTDSPREKFEKLIEEVWNYSSGHTSKPNLKLEEFFDYYFNMIWAIGLSIPTDYVDKHPFDLTGGDISKVFRLSNDLKRGSTATQEDLSQDETIKEHFGLETPTNKKDFIVLIDGIEVFRPLKYSALPATKSKLTDPMIFVGQCNQRFDNIDKEISSGPLKFEAYLFWAPKIAPRDHRGSLIRINGASGMPFDDSFNKYQVAEIRRLNQITCEIFVSEGLDGALNIDRESFNFSHPHYVYITTWLHSALRQLATTEKKLASAVREKQREKSTSNTIDKIRTISEAHWEKVADDITSPPDVQFKAKDLLDDTESSADSYVFPPTIVEPFKPSTNTPAAKKEQTIAEEKIKAIAQVLSAYGLLDNLSPSKQESLLKSIAEIIATKDGE